VAALSGWAVVIAIIAAASLPLAARLRVGKRAAPGSPPIRAHVALGVATSVLAFTHTLTALPALGSPAATAGGALALVPGGAAFFVLIAHSGIGLQLRDPKLRARAEKRKVHGLTAMTIVATAALHVAALEAATRR
jgi:hypothetical protein